MNTDGNLAALNAWQREQDAIEAGDLHLEKLGIRNNVCNPDK